MKKLLFSVIALLLLSTVKSVAGPGDTIVVQTFTFGSPHSGLFVFPSDTVKFEKIFMKYTLKCDPNQNPACGQWDYLTYTYLYQNTHTLDSTLIHQPTFTVNGNSPDSVPYMRHPTYNYTHTWQYYTVHTSTTSLATDTIGTGNRNWDVPFGSANAVSRSQFLWKASEMSTAGMTAGNITGLQFYLQTLGSQMRNLTIRLQLTTLDSLTQATFTNTGFSTVYSMNTTFSATGWNSLQLTNPFNWDGTSNLLIDISYDDNAPGLSTYLRADSTVYKSGLYNAGNDRVALFHSVGQVDVPTNNSFAAIDSFVTVAYWNYGDTALQPQPGTCFEAIDSAGNRVLNSHDPWSDSNVYWDAGNTAASYDRINKLAQAAEIKGNWNFWTFTKNVGTGSMKIYLNGVLWYSGTGMTRRMRNIKTIRIGKGNWSGSATYEGRMDDFMVFNKELSLAEIQGYMNHAITPSDPNYSHLSVYYRFNDGNYQTAADSANGNHSPALLSSVANPYKPSFELTHGFNETHFRPNVVFEQGVYTSHLDSLQVLDSTETTPFTIVLYNDSTIHPGQSTGSIVGWPVTTSVTPDSLINLHYYNYYHKFPKINQFELGRYITPYGNGLSLGNGWTWTFDVSDYRTLLHDTVSLNAGNWQELLDVKFLMIEGTPPRDILGIQNMYNGGFNYGDASNPINNQLPPKVFNIPNNAMNVRWKSRVTGHGMDMPENCAEFCPKDHYYLVNGTTQFTKTVWRKTCPLNPLYPQGGTWVYERSNWCPGAEVWTYDMELTPFTTPGSPITLDHQVQPYVHTSGWDYYQIEDQLVYYGAPNHTLDAEIVNILSPTTDQMYLRFNPVCTNPIIIIRNTGATTLTSLTINYGLNTATPSVYNWTGNLKFMEIDTVKLGNFTWSQTASRFVVTISNPNGGADQYPYNNTMSTQFTYPPVMPSHFIIEMRTNNNPQENQWTLKDAGGNIIHQRNNMTANTTYRDTMFLPFGCYEFELTDAGEDGLSFWANTSQGTGYIKFRTISPNTPLKNFGADFGAQVYQQFTVGLTNGITDYILTDKVTLGVYPNPTEGHFYINIDLPRRDNGQVDIRDVMGKKVYHYEFKNLTAESIEADLSDLPAGMYFVTLVSGNDQVTQKLILH